MQRISNSKEANIYVKKKYVIILEPVISTSKIENETGAIIGSSYWEFREIRGGFTEIEGSKSKGKKKKVWFESSGGSGNRRFEKSGFFYCNSFDIEIIYEFQKTNPTCTAKAGLFQ